MKKRIFALFASIVLVFAVSIVSTGCTRKDNYIEKYAFSSCVKLVDISLPKGLKGIPEGLFWKSSALNRVIVPEGITQIGSYAFSGCLSLTEIKLPSTVTVLDKNAFSNCSALSDIVLPDGNIDRRLLASRAFINDEKKRLLDSITLRKIVEICKESAVAQAEKGRNVIIDAPLLFTSGLWSICHRTVKIYAPVEVRLERILQRDGISREEALKRFSRQTDEDRESEAADIVINNFPPYDITEEINKYF
jgi:dephospho-CoA kinase